MVLLINIDELSDQLLIQFIRLFRTNLFPSELLTPDTQRNSVTDRYRRRRRERGGERERERGERGGERGGETRERER